MWQCREFCLVPSNVFIQIMEIFFTVSITDLHMYSKPQYFTKKEKSSRIPSKFFIYFFVKSHHLIWLTMANELLEILVLSSSPLLYCYPYFPSWLLHCSMYIQEWNFKFPPSWCIADPSSTSPAPLAVPVTANCRGQASDCGCDCAFQYVFAHLQCW